MKKKFWIAILAVVLLLNIPPVMTPSAAADDAQSLGTFCYVCTGCKKLQYLEILEYLPASSTGHQENGYHWKHVKCPSCGKEDYFTGDEDKHTGGTETPTCTTGKTCEKCGGEYGILGHDWGEWTSNGDNKTHSRTCKRDGCSAVDTADCGGDSSATCVTLGTCTDCGGQYYGGHAFPARWKWDSDTEVGRDAESHWVWCLNCTEAKAYMNSHTFVQGNMHLKSPATCVSKPVYYVNCSTCYYKTSYKKSIGRIEKSRKNIWQELRQKGAAQKPLAKAKGGSGS